MSKSRPWYYDNGARNYVKLLLAKAGFPLEIQVSRICQDFARSHNRPQKHMFVDAERLVYGDATREESFREIDQCITFYKELELRKTLGVQLQLEVPIECKHRDDVEVFGFPTRSFAESLCTYPVVSSLAQTTMVRRLAKLTPKFIRNDQICRIGLVQIEKGRTPKRFDDENLDYKAGTALYDFIRADGSGDTTDGIGSYAEQFGLMEKFKEYLHDVQLDWLYGAGEWLDKLPLETYIEFNRRNLPKLPSILYFGIKLYFPVVCLDSPLYLISYTKRGNILNFRPKDFLLCAIRIPKWPGELGRVLAVRSPEGLVAVVNPSGLTQVLNEMLGWFNSIASSLLAEEQGTVTRTFMQGSFAQAVFKTFEKEYSDLSRFYRSDLGFLSDWN